MRAGGWFVPQAGAGIPWLGFLACDLGSFLAEIWQGERGRSTNLPSFNGSPSPGSQICTQLTIFSSFLFGDKNKINQVLAKVDRVFLWLNGVNWALIPIDTGANPVEPDLDTNHHSSQEHEDYKGYKDLQNSKVAEAYYNETMENYERER